MAAGMDHIVEGPEGTEISGESSEDLARATITADVRPGERLRVVKLLAYGWSSRRSTVAVRAQVIGALAEARHTGWDGLLAGQRGYLDDFWERADVEVGGDAELQQAVRFALFHTLQAGARAERQAIAAMGLTGPGYDGHAFWNTETFVLPVLTYTAPDAAGDALRWRHATLGLARERARLLLSTGPRFPGGRSTGGNARDTGRRARPRSMSTPTSPTRSAVITPPPAIRHSSVPPGSSCSSRRRASGAHSDITMPAGGFVSTA